MKAQVEELFLSLGLPRAGSTWNTDSGGVGMEDQPSGRKGRGDILRPAIIVFSKAQDSFYKLFFI